jgi:hypothetical protein
MKLKFLPLAAVLVTALGYSQEIKVKKGEIQIDGKSVAKIDKEKNNNTISNLSGKALFTATITNETPLKNTASNYWMQLTSSSGVVKELEHIPKTSFSFGFENPITENLIKSNDPLLPASRIDERKINSFFQSEDRSISASEDTIIEKDREIIQSEDTLAAENGILSYNQQNKEIEDTAKADSNNIYDIAGYIIDKNGNKKEGTITMEFESISAKLGREKNISDLTSYGTFVLLTSNGKTETHKAKGGVKFCAGERCFLGANGSEDSGTGNSSGSQLSALGESLFFEILAENDGNYVLNYIKNHRHLYLKLANEPKTIYLGDKAGFGTKKPEKIKKIFDEYMKCPTLDISKYDTKSKEGLVQVLADYSVQCKK